MCVTRGDGQSCDKKCHIDDAESLLILWIPSDAKLGWPDESRESHSQAHAMLRV